MRLQLKHLSKKEIDMPLSNGKPVCINHPKIQMGRIPDYYAITKVDKIGDKVNFNLGTGIPLVVFTCPECGYLELYPAVKFNDWHEGRIFVKCKSCASDFLSPIQLDKSSFESANLNNNSFQCPKCNKANSYDKEDMHFK